VLLAGAGITIRSSINTYSTPIGVNTSNVLTMHINLPEAKYPRVNDQVSFHRSLKTKLESLPGVEVVSLASMLPTAGMLYFPYEPEGRPPADPGHQPGTAALVVGADYFRVMQVRARRGREFNESDGITGAPAVVVNQSFAAKAWPGEDPIGKHLRLRQSWLTVIGIVPDILQGFQNNQERGPIIYLPYASDPQRMMFIVARTAVPPSTLAEAFRREVQSLDENMAVYDVRTLEDRIAMSRLNVSSWGIIFTIFAGVALVLASVGLYAVVAHSVSQRTREIGVRMALGGTRRDIIALVFAQGMRRIVIGLAVGLPLGFAVTFALRAALFGVAPGDPVTLVAAALVLILAGVLGCALPARRAIRVDPIVALRCD
jgi:predicted permease